ncbi:unnamed protein product [Closterium sp. NIES-53]
MYAIADSAEGDCYLSVLSDPGIAAAALGASASAAPGTGASAAPGAGASSLSGTAPTESLHTFTLDSGASCSFFRDSTMLTPLSQPVAVSLANPLGGPVLAHSSTVLPCPAAPSGLLSGLHLPSFSTNLVAASSQVFAAASRSSPASAPCSCRPLSHETLLWHHHLGHPSLGHASSSRYGLPCPCLGSTPLPPSPSSGACPHLCSFGRGHAGHERYFLLVVDDYSRYTTVFPLRSKGEVPEVLIDWIRGARRQLSESFGSDHPQNGIAERRIGMVMDVARTSMIHADAPHFLWLFAVQYAAHQINLQPRVSLPETTPTLRWTGKVGDASAFRVWGSRAFVRDTIVDKLSSRVVPCVFLGFPPDAPGRQFYHPTSRLFCPLRTSRLTSRCRTTVSFPSALPPPPPPPPLFLAPGTPPVDPLPPQGPAPSGVSQVDPAEPVEVAVESGATRGAGAAGAGTGGGELGRVEPGGAKSGGAESGGAEPGHVEPEGTMSGGAEPARVESGGALGVPSRREPLSPKQLREWYSRRYRGATAAGAAGGAAGAAGGAAGATGAGAAGGAAGAGAAGDGGGTAGPVSAVSGGAARPPPYYVPLLQQVLGSPPSPSPPPSLSPPLVQSQLQLQPASPLPGPSPYSGPTRGLTERRERASRPVSPASRSASPVRSVRVGRVLHLRPPPFPGTHSMTLRPSTAPQRVPLPSPPASSLHAGPDPASNSLRAASPAVKRFLATAVTDLLFESTAASALVTELVDFAAACRLDFATSLVAESASASVYPPSVGGECALRTDVLEDRQEEFECFAASVPHLVSMLIAPEGDPDAPDIPTPRSYAEAIEGPYSSQWQTAMDAEMASWKSTGTYVDEDPPPGANIVSDMWIFRGVDFFKTFSPTPKMTTLRVLLHVAALRDYELHSLDFSTAFLQGSLHKEIWLRRPPGFTGTTLAALGLAPSTFDPSMFLRTDTTLPPFYVLVYVDNLVFGTADTEALAHVLQRFGFTYSSPQSSPLPTGHSLSAPPSDESVEPSDPYPELVGCLITSSMGLVLGGRARVVLTGHADASWVDDLTTQRSSQGYTFSLGSGSISWRSTRSSSVLSSSCEAEIYAGLVSGAQTGAQNEAHCCATSLLESCSSVASFVLFTWPLRPTLLMFSPRHFSLVIISVSVLC